MRIDETRLRAIVRREIVKRLATNEGVTRDTQGVTNGNPLLASSKNSQLLESRRVTLSEGMRHHISNGIRLDDPVYRPGSAEFFRLFREAKSLYRQGLYEATLEESEILESDIGEWGLYEGVRVPLDFPVWEVILPEAKYKGREVTLGAAGAKRSGGRAHVYVRDPKTGKVKKVSFGSGMADAMGDSDAHRKRRKSFGDRHDCAGKKDKTKAGYWACRATKMFGRNIAGWW
jgi:hypothetical protein